MDTDARTGDQGSGTTERILDDPAWFGASMGTAAVASVAALNPGRAEAVRAVSHTLGVLLLGASALVFVFLFIRDFGIRGLGRTLVAQLRSPVTGASYATIPGSINVMALASIHLWPQLATSTAGWWLLAVAATTGTGLGLWLTVEFFVSTFEHPEVDARSISGVWFIPETVVLLGSLLFSELARTGPTSMGQNLTVVAFALLGAGALLFAFTAAIFLNRLVLYSHDRRREVPTVVIMLSPLAITSLALQAVARDASLVGGIWSAALLEMAAMLAAMLWGFGLWWLAVVLVIARHAGRDALTGTARDWGYVFPPAAMVIATLVLGRFWTAPIVEALGALLSLGLLVVWATIATRSIGIIRRSRS
jgi:tellurite resistance protein TehA-like permease